MAEGSRWAKEVLTRAVVCGSARKCSSETRIEARWTSGLGSFRPESTCCCRVVSRIRVLKEEAAFRTAA